MGKKNHKLVTYSSEYKKNITKKTSTVGSKCQVGSGEQSGILLPSTGVAEEERLYC